MKRALRFVLLMNVVICSFLMVLFSSRVDDAKLLAPFFLILALVFMFIYALIERNSSAIEPFDEETSLAENQTDNEKRSLSAFEKDREHELDNLLASLEVAQTGLHTAIESKDAEKICDAEKSLNANLSLLLDFFENYSNFGKSINRRHHK